MAQNSILVGKKTKFLNLIYVSDKQDIEKFPEDVRKAICIEGDSIRVDSLEYANGELIPFGVYIAWEKADKPEDKERCPHGYNLWNKANAAKQLAEGILEEVDGRFRLTKIVPIQAQLFTGEIPEIFAHAPTFDGQVTVKDDVLSIETPWGVSDCKVGNGFAIVYGICSESTNTPEKFWGNLDGNILTVGTQSFEDYYHVTEEGKIIETLREYFEKL